jgi:hypothetical protein
MPSFQEVFCPCGLYLGRYEPDTWDYPGEYSFDVDFVDDAGVVYCSEECLEEAQLEDE